ncbi:MAG: DUF4160 domain-containing protein [Micrococcales bacterium]|nr:DUF4160 domain-containing protein [Micrococcales bacterium]
MPTVERIGPYRFFFYSNESEEPPHIHVERDRGAVTAKFWLGPVQLARSDLPGTETRALGRIVVQHRRAFEEAWHDHFGR